jgi:hypothetical protein
MGNSQHVNCLRGKTSSANTRFCPRKLIPPPTSGPAQREVDGDTRAAAGAEGDVHGTSSRRGTPRSREPKHQATVDRDQIRPAPHRRTEEQRGTQRTLLQEHSASSNSLSNHQQRKYSGKQGPER